MNSIISFPKLIEFLSRATSQEKSFCEKFVHAFSAGVGDALCAGEVVRLKGFGQFRVDVIDGIRNVVFIPDKEMADAINAPFACFEPVELAPGVSAEVLAEADDDEDSGGGFDGDDHSQAVGDEVMEEFQAEVELEQEAGSTDSGGQAQQLQEERGGESHAQMPLEEDNDEQQPEDSDSMVIDFGIDMPASTVTEEELAQDEAGHGAFDESDSISGWFQNDVPDIGAPAETMDDQKEMPVQSGLSLLTPEARNRRKKVEEKATVVPKGFPWFWVAVAYVGGMAIGFSLGFFGHGFITGNSDDEHTIDLTDDSVAKPDEEAVLDLTSAEDELVETSIGESLAYRIDTAATDEGIDSTAISQAGSHVEPETQQTREPVYDTVTPNRYLTTMAVEHYGNKVFWVYIFLDNQDKIKNPNNVVVGTKLRIPPKEQYDVSATDEKANIEAAKRKQTEIYNKYGSH